MADYLDHLDSATIPALRIFIRSWRVDVSDPDDVFIWFDYIHPDYNIRTPYGSGTPKSVRVAAGEISEEIWAAYRKNPASVIDLPAVGLWDTKRKPVSHATERGLYKIRLEDEGRAYLAKRVGVAVIFDRMQQGELVRMRCISYRGAIEARYCYELHIRVDGPKSQPKVFYAYPADVDPRLFVTPDGIADVWDVYYDEIPIDKTVYFIVYANLFFDDHTLPAGPKGKMLTNAPRIIAVRPATYATVSAEYVKWKKEQLDRAQAAVSMPLFDSIHRSCVEMKAKRAVDGDTIEATELLSTKFKDDILREFRRMHPDKEESYSFRVVGLNAPELKTFDKDVYKWQVQEGGVAAYRFTQSMLELSGGTFFFLHERDLGFGGYDRYGRPLGEVYIPVVIDGKTKYYNLGLMMLREGLVDPMFFLQAGQWNAKYARESDYTFWANYGKKTYEEHMRFDLQDVWEPRHMSAEFGGWCDLDVVHGALPANGMRIGDVQLVVPPTAIRVRRSAETLRLPLIRNNTAIKKTTGHTDTVIELDLYFHSAETINGRPYYDPNMGVFYFIDGLRPLIAQFRRVPFVPIDNTLLNGVYGITAVTLLSINVATVPGFPGSLHAELKLLPFNHRVFLPDSPLLAGSIIWPLFRRYYQMAINHNTRDKYPRWPADGKLRLCAVPETGLRQECELYVVSEDAARDLAAAKALRGQIGYVLAGNRPVTDFQRRYMAWVGIDRALKMSRIYDSIGNTEKAVVEYADRIFELNNKASVDYGALCYLLGRPHALFPNPSALQCTANTEIVYKHYRAITYFPSYDPSSWPKPPILISIGGAGLRQYLDNPDIDFSKIGPCYILELGGTEYANIPGFIRLYLHDEKHKTYIVSPFYLVRAGDLKLLAADYTDPADWKRRNESYIKRCEKELVPDAALIPHMGDLIPTSISVALNNIVVDMTPSGEEFGAHQYLGCMDAAIRVVFETVNADALHDLNRLVSHVNNLSRQYRYGMESGFMLFHNDIAQLFGVGSVIVDSISSQTVEGQPGLYRVELILSAFDRAQRETEELDALMEANEELFNLEKRESLNRGAFFKVIEDRMRKRSAYPDLELPKYKDVNTWIEQMLRGQGYEGNIAGYLMRPARPDINPIDEVYVDPDFYIMRSDTFKQNVRAILDSDMNLDIQSLVTGESGCMQSATRTYKDLVPMTMTARQARQTAEGLEPEKQASRIGQLVPVDSRPPIIGCDVERCDTCRVTAQVDEHPDYGARSQRVKPDNSPVAFVQAFLRLYAVRVTKDSPDGLMPSPLRGSGVGKPGKFRKSMHTAKASASASDFPIGTIIRVCDDYYSQLPNRGYYVIEEHIQSDDDMKHFINGIPVIGIFIPTPEDPAAILYDKPVDIEIIGKVTFDPDRQDHEDCRESFYTIMPCARQQYMADLMQSGSVAEAAGVGNYYGLPADPAQAALVDMFRYDCRGRLVRAFPTYRLFFVDEGRWVGSYRLMDNYYGLNAVISIDLYNSRKTAAPTCVIHLGNTYGHLTTLQYRDAIPTDAPGLFWNFFKVGPSDPSFMALLAYRAQSVESVFLRPGARVHLRMGYGSDISALPVVFNGSVTEFMPGDISRIVAQGDGIEFTVPAGDGIKKAEARDRISELMMGDMTGIEKTKFGATEGRWDSGKMRAAHFGEPFFYDSSWSYATGEMTHNVYIGAGVAKLREAPEGWMEWTAALAAAAAYVGRLLGASVERPADYYDELNIGVNETGKTIWDVFQTYAACLSDYVAAVVPFENRSTLFYGRPNWLLRYEYTADGQLRQKTFWQLRLYHSATDILSNQIYVSADGVYNNVRLRYNVRGKDKNKVSGASVVVHADVDIVPEEQRTAVVVSDIELGVPLLRGLPGLSHLLKPLWEDAAYNYATTALVLYMKDMYKGPLLVIGDPTVKPHDPSYVFDQYRQMHGLFQVKEVAHHMSQETGFITSIVPDCCVAATNGDMVRWWAMLGSVGSYTLYSLSVMSILNALAVNAFHRSALASAIARGETAAAVEGANILQKWRTFWTQNEAKLASWLTANKTGFFVGLGIQALITVIVVALTESLFRYIGHTARARQAVVVAPLRLNNRDLSVLLKGSKGAVVGTMASDADSTWAGVAKFFGHHINYQYQVSPTNVKWYKVDELREYLEPAVEDAPEPSAAASQLETSFDAASAPVISDAKVSSGASVSSTESVASFDPEGVRFYYTALSHYSVPDIEVKPNGNFILDVARYKQDMQFLCNELTEAHIRRLPGPWRWSGICYLTGYKGNDGCLNHLLCQMTYEDVVCFVAMMYAECGNQPFLGKQAVASVILNRAYVNFPGLDLPRIRFLEQTPGYSPLRLVLYQRHRYYEFSPVANQKTWQGQLKNAIATSASIDGDDCVRAIQYALKMTRPSYLPDIMHALYFGNEETAKETGREDALWMWKTQFVHCYPRQESSVRSKYKELYGLHDFAEPKNRDLSKHPKRPAVSVKFGN